MSTDQNYLTPRRRNAVAGLARFGIIANVAVFAASALILPLAGTVVMFAGAICLILDRILSAMAAFVRRAFVRRWREPLAAFKTERVIERVQRRFGYSCRAVPTTVAGKHQSLAINFSLAHLFAPRTAELDDHARYFLATLMSTVGRDIMRLDIVIYCNGDEACRRAQASALTRGIRDAGVICPIGEFVVVGTMGERRGPSVELIVRGRSEELPRAA